MAAGPRGRQPRAFRVVYHQEPAASGRVYAAYGCVYVVAAPWLKVVDGAPPSATDIAGGAAALLGMLVIISGWGNASP